jgi:hypothetical protein
MGFEPTIPVFELAKTFHALDRSATEIGRPNISKEVGLLLCVTKNYAMK